MLTWEDDFNLFLYSGCHFLVLVWTHRHLFCYVKPFCVYACVCRCECRCVLFSVICHVLLWSMCLVQFLNSWKVFCEEHLMMLASYTSLTIFVSPPIINLICALIPSQFISFKLLYKMYSQYSAIAFVSSSTSGLEPLSQVTSVSWVMLLL